VSQVRPVRWHDLPLVYRLIGHGVSFDSQFNVTVGEDGLRSSLFRFQSDIHATVLRAPRPGLAVLSYPAGALCAGLAYIAPALDEKATESMWLRLLDGVTAYAGEQGIGAIRAEVDENDRVAFEALRRTDFAVYTRQTLWAGLPTRRAEARAKLRRAEPAEIKATAESWNTRVPGLLRQAQVLPDHMAECYLLDERHSPCGLAAVHRGSQRALVDLYMPLESARQVEAILEMLLPLVSKNARQIVFRLRHDMEWLGNPLERLGFDAVGTQVVMIRHTLAHVQHYSFKTAPAKTGPLPTAGIVELGQMGELTAFEQRQPVTAHATGEGS
jgi:hypothetical protein